MFGIIGILCRGYKINMHDALIPSRESPRYVPFCVHSFFFSARDAFFRMPLMVRGGCVVKPLVLSNSFWNFSCVLSKFLLHWTLCSNLSWWCCIHLPKFLSLMTVMLIEEMKKQSSGINRAPPPPPRDSASLKCTLSRCAPQVGRRIRLFLTSKFWDEALYWVVRHQATQSSTQ